MAGNKDDVLSLDSGEEGSEFSGFEPLKDSEAKQVCVSKVSDVVGSNIQEKKKGKASSKTSKTPNDNVLSSSTKKSAKTSVQKDSVLPSVSSAPSGSAKSCSSKSVSQRSLVSKSSSKSKTSKTKKSNTIDLDNLSENDILKLRQVIGLESVNFGHEMADEEDINYVFGDSLENLPEVHVEFENEGPCSDVEVIPMSENNSSKQPLRAIENEISNALFDSEKVQNSPADHNEVVTYDDSFMWQLPKLKVPQRGDPISPSLASLINVACSSQCDTDEIMTKYKLPSNCEKLAPPLVNGEIWSEIQKKAQTYDKAFRDIQSLIASGLIPMFELLTVLKDQIQSNAKARTLLSDSITLLGQAQFNLSLRRRYMIRPYLKKKYANLCNINTPITSFLFGDDVQKEIRKCDTSMSVTKEQYNFYGPQRTRGRARGRGASQRGYGYHAYGNFQAGRSYNRYQPYGRPPMQFSQYRYPTQYQIPKKAKKTATVTSPEDMAS